MPREGVAILDVTIRPTQPVTFSASLLGSQFPHMSSEENHVEPRRFYGCGVMVVSEDTYGT